MKDEISNNFFFLYKLNIDIPLMLVYILHYRKEGIFNGLSGDS